MKILYANGRPLAPFAIGGEGVNSHTILEYLASGSDSCMALGVSHAQGIYDVPSFFERLKIFQEKKIKSKHEIHVQNGYPSIQISYQYNYPCRMVNSRNFISELNFLITTFHPDLIMTQLDQAEKVLQIAQQHNIACVLYVQDVENENLILLHAAVQYKAAGVFYASQFAKKYFEKMIRTPQCVMYPPINIGEYETHTNQTYITIINPVLYKGGKLFEQIVQRLPQYNFLAVKGWYDPIKDGINLTKYANVKVLSKQQDIKQVYAQTKILLVPSIWRECCPRVILEANASGIPVIASNIGGIKEALNNGGMLINRYWDVNAWIKEITDLSSNTQKYTTYRVAAKNNAKLFSSDKLVPSFRKYLSKVTSSHR